MNSPVHRMAADRGYPDSAVRGRSEQEVIDRLLFGSEMRRRAARVSLVAAAVGFWMLAGMFLWMSAAR